MAGSTGIDLSKLFPNVDFTDSSASKSKFELFPIFEGLVRSIDINFFSNGVSRTHLTYLPEDCPINYTPNQKRTFPFFKKKQIINFQYIEFLLQANLKEVYVPFQISPGTLEGSVIKTYVGIWRDVNGKSNKGYFLTRLDDDLRQYFGNIEQYFPSPNPLISKNYKVIYAL